MLNKEDLSAIINISFEDPIEIDLAWEAYLRFNDYVQSADIKTMKYFLSVISYTEKEMLSLRNIMAENGNELTPSQLSQYILILAVSFFDKLQNLMDTTTNEQ